MTRSKFLRVATLVCAAAITVTACGERKPTPAVESTTATGASVSTDTVKVQGVWSDTVTAQSGYLAEYVNGKLVVIEEQMMFPDGTRSTRAYFYNADYTPTRLFEHRALTAASSNSTPKTLHSLLNIYLTGDHVDSTTKQVDFVVKTVQPYEIENMRKHERELFVRVPTTYTASRTDR